MVKSKSQEKREAIVNEAEEKEEPKEEKKSLVTYIGPGGLNGTYLFKEIAGSITASSEEEAKAKAEEIAIKHPSLLIK